MSPSEPSNNAQSASPTGVPSSASPQGSSNVPASSSYNGLAIAGLVLAFIIPLVGLILSILGLSAVKKNNQKGKGLALAGIILSVLFMLIQAGLFIALAAAGNKAADDLEKSTSSLNVADPTDRADSQKKDIEIKPGEVATIEGVDMTLSNVKFATTLGQFDEAKSGHTYVVADVAIVNKSDRTRAFNSFDFRVQTASGQVLDTAFATLPNPLSYGDLIAGGKTSGQIVFEIPVATGSEYIIWKPSFLNTTRAVIQIK